MACEQLHQFFSWRNAWLTWNVKGVDFHLMFILPPFSFVCVTMRWCCWWWWVRGDLESKNFQLLATLLNDNRQDSIGQHCHYMVLWYSNDQAQPRDMANPLYEMLMPNPALRTDSILKEKIHVMTSSNSPFCLIRLGFMHPWMQQHAQVCHFFFYFQ